MTTVDDLLTKIINHNFSETEKLLPQKDAKVLKNLFKLINEPLYITENQGKLLLKILNEHRSSMPEFTESIINATSSPSWLRKFRVIDNFKKIYISNDYDCAHIVIETSFSSEIRKFISQLTKDVHGIVQISSGKKYLADLTEKNISYIIEKLSPYKFDISDDLKDYYKTIKSWSKVDVENQYRITTISYPNFEKQIVNDLGIDTAIDQNIINDRSNRYQYYVENSKKTPENLTELIANRNQSKVWINKDSYELDAVFTSLQQLRRFPSLIVFDTRDSKKCLEKLQKISESLDKAGINSGVGIYFRLDNDEFGKEFNQLIANKHYNCQLDLNTKIVGVQNGKIPKFLLKSNWKPMSVISLDHTLRHSKTAVYANCCDLVITYTNSEPIIEARNPWE